MYQPNIIIALLVLGSMLLLAATAMLFRSRRIAVICAVVAMLVTDASNAVMHNTNAKLFWGVATLIVLAIDFLQPKAEAKSQFGMPYIGGGAIVGMVLGMLTNTMAGIITGAALGALMGAIAFARTPEGLIYPFPSEPFFSNLAAKGLPAVVTMSMVGATLIQLIITTY